MADPPNTRPKLTRKQVDQLAKEAREREIAFQKAKRKLSREDEAEKTAFRPCTECSMFGVGGTPANGAQDPRFSLKTGVELHNTSDDARSHFSDTVQMKTTKACKDPHVVQFVHRIVERDGKIFQDYIPAPNGTKYPTTMDRNNPVWHLDRVDGKSPYYDADNANRSHAPRCRCDGTLTAWDEPSVLPKEGEKQEAHFKTFFMCDGKVVGEVDWSRVQEWKRGAAAAGDAVYTANVVQDSGGVFNWVQRYVDDFNNVHASRFNWTFQVGSNAPAMPAISPVPIQWPPLPTFPGGGA